MRWMSPVLGAVCALVLVGEVSGQGISGEVGVRLVWVSGDTHVHHQTCFDITCMSPQEIFDEQRGQGVRVVSALVYTRPEDSAMTDPNPSRPGTYCPDVIEDPIISMYCLMHETMDPPVTHIDPTDPKYIFEYGIELAKLQSYAGQWGHGMILNLTDPFFHPYDLYPASIFDFFRAQPGAVTGYAHIRWPTSGDGSTACIQSVPGAPGSESPPFPLPPILDEPFTYMAPVDVALGRIDFLETLSARVNTSNAGNWAPLYYGLLNTGFRLGLAGGSDNVCVADFIGGCRTYALVQPPVTYDKWVEALKAGRTSIATGKEEFLQLLADGKHVGFVIDRTTGNTQVDLEARFTFTPEVVSGDLNDTVEFIVNGCVVYSEPVTLDAAGQTKTVNASFDFTESGWVAARTTRTHTSPAYVIVDGQHVSSPSDAEYFRDYCDQLAVYADSPSFSTTLNAQSGAVLVDRTAEIVDYIKNASDVFAELAGQPNPSPTPIVTPSSVTDEVQALLDWYPDMLCDGRDSVCSCDPD